MSVVVTFPTELFDDVGAYLAKKGHEFGATTGRPRRCGWFDGVGLRQAVRINSVTGLCLTKLDVLDGLETVRMCVDYKNPAGESIAAPFDCEDYNTITPIYEDMPGWTESTVGAKSLAELPENARAYIRRIEEIVGVPIDIVSTGSRSDRDNCLAPPLRLSNLADARKLKCRCLQRHFCLCTPHS